MLLHTVSETDSGSLSYMISLLKSEFGIVMEKQSLNERFNEKCVAFVKAVLSELLKEQFAPLYSGKLMQVFSRIRIKDSTKFMVPATLEANYKYAAPHMLDQ